MVLSPRTTVHSDADHNVACGSVEIASGTLWAEAPDTWERPSPIATHSSCSLTPWPQKVPQPVAQLPTSCGGGRIHLCAITKTLHIRKWWLRDSTPNLSRVARFPCQPPIANPYRGKGDTSPLVTEQGGPHLRAATSYCLPVTFHGRFLLHPETGLNSGRAGCQFHKTAPNLRCINPNNSCAKRTWPIVKLHSPGGVRIPSPQLQSQDGMRRESVFLGGF